MTSESKAEIVAAVDEAKKQFAATGAQGLRASRDEFVAAVAQLDRYLQGPNGSGWRTFLGWPQLERQVDLAAEPNPAALAAVHARLHSAYPGLELKPFVDLRRALDAYLGCIEWMNVNEATYREHLETIAAAVQNPAPPQLRKLADSAAELQRGGRAPKVLSLLRKRLSFSNITFHASDRFVWTGVSRPIDETAPLNDFILGTRIRGTGRTIGYAEAHLVPDPNRALIATNIRAMNHAQTVGQNGPALIYSVGDSELAARKLLVATPDGLSALPAEVEVHTNSRITGFGSTKQGVVDRLVKKIAAKRAPAEAARGTRLAEDHARRIFRTKVDEQAEPMLARANERFLRKIRNPLMRVDAYPQSMHFSTTTDYLNVVGLQTGDAELGAPTPVPDAQRPADVLVRMHESLVNNTAENLLSGRLLDQPAIDRFSLELFGAVPEPPEGESREPWSIAFAPVRPLT
ncbi:MAG TPA: hypothetical protein VG713_03535, partial [Pirellulales bacterium]|nr:hypothetical protein [Pirellulales bacterium]